MTHAHPSQCPPSRSAARSTFFLTRPTPRPQAQAETVRRRKESEKADIEAAAQKAEAAEFDVFGRPIEGRIDPAEAKRRAMLEEQQRAITAQRAEKAAEKAAAKEAERQEEAREAARIERDRAQLREQFETEQQQRRSKDEAKGGAAGGDGGGAQGGGFLSKEEKQKMQAAAYHRKMDERDRLERMGGVPRGAPAEAPAAERDGGDGAARAGRGGSPAAVAEAAEAAAARAQEQARLQRAAAAAEAERGALRQQNEALQAAVREQVRLLVFGLSRSTDSASPFGACWRLLLL